MKNRTLLIVFLAATVVVIAGAFMKIQHLESAGTVLLISLLAQLFAIVGLVLRAARTKKEDL